MFSYSLLFGVVLLGLFSGCWSLGSLDSLMIVWCLLVGHWISKGHQADLRFGRIWVEKKGFMLFELTQQVLSVF